MLTFLRKIRKSLIDSGSAQKYLFYAIGEIALVVIGILIALQINNWNEERKDREMEKKLILELHGNLRSDIIFFKDQIDIQMGIIDQINTIITYLETNLSFADTLNTSRVGYLEQFQVNRSAYETIKNIGLEKLTSKVLKNEVTKYYEIEMPAMLRVVNQLNEEQRNTRVQYQREKMKSVQGSPGVFWRLSTSEDPFFKNYLHYRVNWKRNFIEDILYPSMNKAEQIISKIEDELGGPDLFD